MAFTLGFLSNTVRIPSFECGRTCRKPCQEHKSQSCLQVLGSEAAVANMGGFWAANAEAMTLAASSLVNSHAFTATFTPQEFDSYRAGVMDLVGFFEACLQEKLDKERPKP